MPNFARANRARAKLAEALLNEAGFGNDRMQDDLTDLLADLMHMCRLSAETDETVNFDESLEVARTSFRAECFMGGPIDV